MVCSSRVARIVSGVMLSQPAKLLRFCRRFHAGRGSVQQTAPGCGSKKLIEGCQSVLFVCVLAHALSWCPHNRTLCTAQVCYLIDTGVLSQRHSHHTHTHTRACMYLYARTCVCVCICASVHTGVLSQRHSHQQQGLRSRRQSNAHGLSSHQSSNMGNRPTHHRYSAVGEILSKRCVCVCGSQTRRPGPFAGTGREFIMMSV